MRVTERGLEWGVGLTHEPPPRTERFLARGSSLQLRAQPLVVGTPGTEYRFVGFLISGLISPGFPSGSLYRALDLTVSNPMTFGAIYEKYHMVSVETTPGTSVEEWRRAGEYLTLRAQRDVPMGGILGILGAKYRFQAWNIAGSLAADEHISYEVKMPVKIRAEYEEDYSQPRLYALILLVTMTALALAVLNRS